MIKDTPEASVAASGIIGIQDVDTRVTTGSVCTAQSKMRQEDRQREGAEKE